MTATEKAFTTAGIVFMSSARIMAVVTCYEIDITFRHSGNRIAVIRNPFQPKTSVDSGFHRGWPRNDSAIIHTK